MIGVCLMVMSIASDPVWGRCDVPACQAASKAIVEAKSLDGFAWHRLADGSSCLRQKGETE